MRLGLLGKVAEEVESRSELYDLRVRECQKLLETLKSMGVAPPMRRYSAGQDIFSEGDCGDGIYVLAEGTAKLLKSILEREQIVLRLLGPWEIFGDLIPGASLSQGARALAFTDCEVTKIPKVFVERAVKADPIVASGLLTLFGIEIAQSKELAACLAPRKTEARLAALLPILVEKFGITGLGEGMVLPPLTHYDLAEMVAATRESVTAAMQSLTKRGLLKKEGRTITILKPDRLAELATRQGRAMSLPVAPKTDFETNPRTWRGG